MTEGYSVAIVDDEAVTRAALVEGTRRAAGEAGVQVDLASFPCAEDLLGSDLEVYDIILLDIAMQGMDGMACARRIRETNRDVLILFVTSMVQYAVQGYQVEAFDYLVKPFTPGVLEQSLGRAFQKLRDRAPRRITVKTAGGMRPLRVETIAYVEAVNHSSVFHLKREPEPDRHAEGSETVFELIPCPMTLSAVEGQLKDFGFFRVHAAFLVNLAGVERVTNTDAVVAGVSIPVSKHRRQALLKALTAWWGKKL